MAETKKRCNQFGEMVGAEDEYMSVESWATRWSTGQTGFHMTQIHPMLTKHYDKITSGQASSRFFLPLCGKSIDLHWLAEMGNAVIGNEGVELGCRQFFEEHELDYVVSDIGSIPGKVFKSAEEGVDVTLYCCDFLQLTKDVVGPIDCIWDRGGLVAIHVSDRTRYSQVISSLMSPDTRYLLDTFRLDHDHFAGPPYDLPEDTLKDLFSSKCQISSVDEVEILGDWHRSLGITQFKEYVYLLQLKQ